MTGILKVDTAKLMTTASSFDTTANTVQSLTQSMISTVQSLNGEIWSGDAQQKYLAQFSGLEDDIQRMINMIHEHVLDLNDMASAYEQAEQENTVVAGALQQDVIS